MMIKLSQLARDAGLPESEILTAIGVAQAESHASPSAVSPRNKDGSLDVGLWQINTVHKGQAGSPTDEKKFIAYAKDPRHNAELMVSVFKSQGWKAWTRYRDGKYKMYASSRHDRSVSTSAVAVGVVPASAESKSSTDGACAHIAIPMLPDFQLPQFVCDVTGAIGDAAGFVGDAFNAITSGEFWARVFKGIGGSVMILLGGAGILMLLLNKTAPVAVPAIAKVIK